MRRHLVLWLAVAAAVLVTAPAAAAAPAPSRAEVRSLAREDARAFVRERFRTGEFELWRCTRRGPRWTCAMDASSRSEIYCSWDFWVIARRDGGVTQGRTGIACAR